mgnify:FL=1
MGSNVYNTKYDVIYEMLKPEVVHNFLLEHEIDKIINDNKNEFKPARVVALDPNNYNGAINDKVRKCGICDLMDNKYDWLKEKIFNYAKAAIKKSDFPDIDIDRISQIDLLKYEGGDNFNWHTDVSLEGNFRSLQRKFTVIIPLSQYYKDYTGGFLKIKRHPEISDPFNKKFLNKGSAVAFPSFLEHIATPVTSGTRYAIVAWASGPYWR